MKTNNFVRAVSLVLAIALTGPSSFAAEGQNGNGGGGVNINGRHMTFFSAGLVVDRQELSLAQIPQLKMAIDAVMMSSYLPSNVTARYFKALMPSQNRRYYNVSADRFTPETRARLVAEYSRVMKVDGTKVALFAVTDTSTNTTYLLPEFYNLKKPSEQAAILFHEAYWIVNPTATYQQVISVEASFQGYLENSSYAEALFNWLEKIISGDAIVRAAYGLDSASGVLTPMMEKKVLPLKNLIGADAAASGFYCSPNYYVNGYCTTSGSTSMALQSLYEKSLIYPNSWLIRVLISQLSADNLILINLQSSPLKCNLLPYSKNENYALTLNCPEIRGAGNASLQLLKSNIK